MRFVDYLIESRSTPEERFEQLTVLLLNNGKQVLKDLKRTKILPWHGKDIKFNRFKVRKTRKNRQPKDTNNNAHEYFDSQFDIKFGIRGRSNTIFVTGDYREAMLYSAAGDPNILLPLGKYKVLWSNKIKDLSPELENNDDLSYFFDEYSQENLVSNLADEWYDKYGEMDDPEYTEEEFVESGMQDNEKTAMKTLDKILKSYKTGDFKKALASKNEIMIECDQYVLIDAGFEQKLKDWMENL